MLTWLVVVVLGALILGVLLFVRRVRSLPVFLAAYNYTRDQGGTEADSLRAALEVFARRPPFNVLDKSDIEWLSQEFATLPNPKVLGQILLEMDKAGDARGLKMREGMAGLVEDFRQRQEQGQFL